MKKEIEKVLYNINKPYQYVGNEMQAIKKDLNKMACTMAFVFPDKYEIGASNLGQRVLCDVINKNDDLFADRAYAPDVDFKNAIIANNLKITTAATSKELKEFDILAFSLQYELAFPTVLKILDMSNIPIKRKDRDITEPLIIAGGPSALNPLPLADFIDVFMIGDGEDLCVDIMRKYSELKANNISKEEILFELSKIQGAFVPAMYNYHKIPVTPVKEGVPEKVLKRVTQIDYNNIPKSYPVAYSPSIHDRATVEIRRGCGRMCRFCQPGHVTLPIRERKAEDIIKSVKELVDNTGYDEYSLLSLSSNDYTNIESVIEELSCEFNHRGISASLPSQRIDKFSVKLANLVQQVRKSTLTLAPEAGSQRLRNVINKNITEEQIINSALQAYENGFNQLKFYFIVGLPTETYEDLDAMINLLSKIKYLANNMKKENNISQSLNITCTLSIFVPKPFTPFQWHGQIAPDEVMNRIHYLKDKAKSIKGLKLNYHYNLISQIEAVFSRGDAKLNNFIYKLYEKGCYLDSWDENFNYKVWEEAAQECNLSIQELAQKQYLIDEELAWNVIDIGIYPEWLKNEYKKALNSEPSVACEQACSNCGVCKNLNVKKVLDKPYTPNLSSKININKEKTYKYRIKLTKKDYLKFLSHLDWQNTLMKTLYKTKLNLVFTQGFNPIPKVSLGIALPIFIESECEFLDIELYDDIDEKSLMDIIQSKLPNVAIIKNIQKIDKAELSLDNKIQWTEYEATPILKEDEKTLFKNSNLVYISNMVSSNEVYIKKKNKKGIEKNINIKQSIKSFKVLSNSELLPSEDNKILIVLKTGQSSEFPSVRPDVLLKSFLPDTLFEIKKTKVFDINFNEL